MDNFIQRLARLTEEHEALITRPNHKTGTGNGIFDRYAYPVLTGAHTPWHGGMISTREPTRT